MSEVNSKAIKTPLFITPDEARRPVSAVFRSLLEDQNGPLTLQQCMHTLGDRSYGFLLVILAALNLLPAANVVFGLAASVVGVQLALRYKTPWLPSLITNKELPPSFRQKLLTHVLPKIERTERWLKPRWHWTEAGWFDMVLGTAIIFVGLIVLIPIPFTNALPAFVLSLIGLGLAYRDGLVQVVSVVISLLTIVLACLFLSAIIKAVTTHFS